MAAAFSTCSTQSSHGSLLLTQVAPTNCWTYIKFPSHNPRHDLKCVPDYVQSAVSASYLLFDAQLRDDKFFTRFPWIALTKQPVTTQAHIYSS